MDNFRDFLGESAFDDMFDFTPRRLVRSEEEARPMTLELYRGFDADLDKLEQDAHYYYLSPARAEQGQLWFTHRYIAHYDPVEYAKAKGRWFMRYELPVVRHVQVNHWDDGDVSNDLPPWWAERARPAEDGRFYAGIELPKGWVFSYKVEKFIGCRVRLRVPKGWVVPSSSV